MYINFQPPNTSHAHILIGCCAFSIPFIPLESSDLELSNDIQYARVLSICQSAVKDLH